MKTIEVKIYQFEELSDEAKQKAINEHMDFLESLPQEIENEAGELEIYYQLDFTDEEVIENIETNEYIYFFNGEMASCVTYTGNHLQAGQTEFKLFGETYNV